jgi:hypothetical protein
MPMIAILSFMLSISSPPNGLAYASGFAFQK